MAMPNECFIPVDDLSRFFV